MFSFLEKPSIVFKTHFSNETLETLLKKQKFVHSEEIEIELVQRSFGSSFLSKNEVSREQAKSICYAQLQKNSHHNYFDLALAMHATDLKTKEKFLLNAARAHQFSNKNIAGQAAYLLADMFANAKEYIKSQAWLIHGINLGNTEAINTYLKYGFYDKFPSLGIPEISINNEPMNKNSSKNNVRISALILASFVAVTLSDTALSLTNLSWDRYISKNIINILTNANATSDLFSSLMRYEDTYLGHIAVSAAKFDSFVFYEFFKYCAENEIVSAVVDNAVMKFLIDYPERYDIAKIYKPINENKFFTRNPALFLYISCSDGVFILNRDTGDVSKLLIDVKQFDQLIQPTEKPRTASGNDLHYISSLASSVVPTIIDNAIKFKANNRLYNTSEAKDFEKKMDSPPPYSTIKPYDTVTHTIPQYIPAQTFSENNSFINSPYKDPLALESIFIQNPNKKTLSQLCLMPMSGIT